MTYKIRLALEGVIVASAYSLFCAAAESPASRDAVQALCIQEAMVRGAVGERLKGYVDSCVRSKATLPLPDVKPASTDTPAC